MNKISVECEVQRILDTLNREFSVAKRARVREQLWSELESEQRRIYRRLKRDNPFKDNQIALQRSEQELKTKNIATINRLERDVHGFRMLAKQTNSTFDEKFWRSEIQKFKETQEYETKLQALIEKHSANNLKQKERDLNSAHKERVICRRLLLQQWRKLLDKQVAKWEIETLREFRRKLLSGRLREWLKNLQLLADTLHELSIEPGLLFDLSKGNLTLSNIEQLKKWASYISKDKGVRQLCDLMGHMRRAEKTKRQELVKISSTVTQYIPDINSREEIIGVYLGNDIEHALPQEIALLSDDATSIIFDMKFVENRLMCFEMQGMQASSHKIQEEHMMEVEEEEKLGPIIICVDTSGSMQGFPETVAKAITLYIATRAISQQRNCLLINFSTSIETLDLSGRLGITSVIEFLQRSFHGGTDAVPALSYALNMMETEKYVRSDLLVISDFIMATLPEQLHDEILKAKVNKNQFYSLSIGDLFLSERLRDIFDKEWVYNPNNMSIESLQNIVTSI